LKGGEQIDFVWIGILADGPLPLLHAPGHPEQIFMVAGEGVLGTIHDKEGPHLDHGIDHRLQALIDQLFAILDHLR